jgi:predicted nuclease of predicted toxin-antitoxin system
VKFLLDECLAHSYVADFAARGYPDVYHPIHVGWREARDDQLVERAALDARIIVTPNARDFRALLAAVDIHPGAIIIEPLDREKTLRLIFLAIAFAEAQADPALYMINRVIEVTREGGVIPYLLPPR